MAYRELELTLLSARDLKNVNMFTSMDVYAVASISGDPMTRQCTPTDTSGGRNPSWDTTLRFSVPPTAAAAGSAWLHVLLRSERVLGDRDVGEVVVPLADILAGAGNDPGQQPPRLASYQVHTVLRGEPRGVLNVSYRLGPVVAPVVDKSDDKPVLAYPAAPQQPFKPQNPAAAPPQPYQYNPPNGDAYAPSPQPCHSPRDSYAPPAPQQYHSPRDAYAPPAQPYPYHSPRDAYAPTPQQPYHSPRDAYAPPPRWPRYEEEEAMSPAANGKSSNGNGPNQVYMGPHTQIIIGAPAAPTPPPRSNTIPKAKEDEPKPKPSYTPTSKSFKSLEKTEHSWPKSFPQHQDTPTWPNASPKQPDHSTRLQHDTKVIEHAYHAQSKIGTGKTTDNSARPQALTGQDNTTKVSKTNSTQVGGYGSTQSYNQPGKAESMAREAYANTRSNSMPGKPDHQIVHKTVQQHVRVTSMPTATAQQTAHKAVQQHERVTSMPTATAHQTAHKAVQQHERVTSMPTATAR